MSDNTSGAAGDLQPKWSISFKTRSSLSRMINQPLIVDNPVGLVIFGDTATIYLAQVADPGAGVYERLSSVKATTYIHGWAVNSGRLYVLDGVELSSWDLRDGTKRESLKLLKDADAKQAVEALGELQKAIQRVEWATLLEQTEDEWVRLAAQQSAATPLSDERERLDELASDYFRMLKSMREALGSVGGAAAARQLIAELRLALAEKRKVVAPWCFSPPVVRHHSFEEPLRLIFTIRGNGTLYACDKSLTQSSSKKWREKAELQLALLEDSKSNLKLIGYVSDANLFIVDAKTLDEKDHWSPDPAPAAGTSHTLTTGNGQFWWGTDTGVYALQPDENGRLQPTWKSGPPWSTRQVGRHTIPTTPYSPSIDPNDLFEAMNVHAWIAQRPDKSVSLNDGMMAQLLFSDEKGKYTSPPDGKSYLMLWPWSRDSAGATTKWADVRPHPRSPLVLLSDSRGVSVQSRYPSALGGSQLTPQWATAPWLCSVAPGSQIDRTLSTPWDTPKVRQPAKPFADMIAQSLVGNPDAKAVYELAEISPGGHFSDRQLRYVIWFALHGFDSLYIELRTREAAHGHQRFSEFPRWALRHFNLENLHDRFGLYGNVFRFPSQDECKRSFRSIATPVNFDPPWVWPSAPSPQLFHGPPPAWYDPWGYNRPGDFVPQQPSPSFLDPFCFDGQLRFPQRPVTLETAFKGHSWAVFTDNDPASLLASAKRLTDNSENDDLPGLSATSEPYTLVVVADEHRQRTVFQLLPPKPQRVVFDAMNHSMRHEASEFGSIDRRVVASPTVFLNPSRTFPTAWCVVNPEFPAARLRKLATVDPERGASPWDKFVDDNKSQYGPRDGGKIWQIEKCPLPSSALPTVLLQGYDLPEQA
jgi:hypothetical protein